jgi:hypothetical protein
VKTLSLSIAVTAIAALTAIPTQAAKYRHHPYAYGVPGAPPAPATRPRVQGSLTDKNAVWRYGFYQGTDPDPNVRLNLMRDPMNGYWGR